LHLGSSAQLLILHSEYKKYVGLWRLQHVHKVHFKNSWESSHGEGCESLSSLPRSLHRLLVIPVLLCFQSLHLVHFVCRVSPNSKLFREIMTIKERKVGSIKKMLTK
jgi:hypothetical protein